MRLWLWIKHQGQLNDSNRNCDASAFPSTRKPIMLYKHFERVYNLVKVSVHGACHCTIQRSLLIIESDYTWFVNVWVFGRNEETEGVLNLLLRAAFDIGIFKLDKIFWSFEHLGVRVNSVHLHSLAPCKNFALKLDLERLDCPRAVGVVTDYFNLTFIARVKLLLVENDLGWALRAAQSENASNFCRDYCF